jgi:hypothetical protein
VGEDLGALYRRWLSSVWAGERTTGVVHPHFVGHWPAGDVHGPQALEALVRQTRGKFERITFSLDVGPVVEPPLVAARWIGLGVEPGGREVRFVGNDLLRVADRLVIEYWPATVTLDAPLPTPRPMVP